MGECIVLKASALVSSLVGVALIVASAANAHGGNRHEGSVIAGTVRSVSKESVTLGTASGELEVVPSDDTRFVAGDAPTARTAIKAGMRVSVHGSKLPGGAIAARDVTLDASTPAAKPGDEKAGSDQR
jgi:hypothetical protein